MRYPASSRFAVFVATLVVAFASALPAQSTVADSATRREPSGDRSTSLRVLPVLGSAPETGFVGGATALRVSSPAGDTITRSTTEQIYVAYTAKQQVRAFVSTDRWSEGNRWGLSAELEYQRFPQPFFGVGIDAPKSAEEWYEPRSVIARRADPAVFQNAYGPVTSTPVMFVSGVRTCQGPKRASKASSPTSTHAVAGVTRNGRANRR